MLRLLTATVLCLMVLRFVREMSCVVYEAVRLGVMHFRLDILKATKTMFFCVAVTRGLLMFVVWVSFLQSFV